MKLNHKHILGLREMSADEIHLILETAQQFKEVLSRPIRKVPALRGKSVCTLFFEPSTRTRSSFEMAAKILSAETSTVTVASSSVKKGESLKDTVLTMDAMGVDCFVIRHASSGAPEVAARYARGHVLNAGDGCHEHPSQGLLDLLTISQHKSTFENLKVVIVATSGIRAWPEVLFGACIMWARMSRCARRTHCCQRSLKSLAGIWKAILMKRLKMPMSLSCCDYKMSEWTVHFCRRRVNMRNYMD